ncbi:MAG: Rrf2 family transcriptional regulator [Pseudomonadales bacterium]|nr:Rrf2 family transcriptional regulator [Pseudomonadales bacterium]
MEYVVQLKLMTDYALRVLIYLADNPDDVVTMHEISDYHQISAEHLRKVIQRLANENYINSYRGRGGGLRLGRSPADIVIGDVVRRFENDASVIDCEGRGCVLFPGCSLIGVLGKAMRAFYLELDQYTLADVMGSARMKKQLQQISARQV